MLRLGFPVIGVTDLDRAAAFWSAALGLTVSEEWSSAGWRTPAARARLVDDNRAPMTEAAEEGFYRLPLRSHAVANPSTARSWSRSPGC